MAEQKEYIEREAVLLEIQTRRNQGRIGKIEAQRWQKFINGLPSADVRPVVRDTPHMEDAIEAVIAERRR